jgi:hypothetical protein
LSARPKTPTDVVTADDEILTVIGASADQDMDVWIVGIPMIDGNPVEFCAEVALGIGHQITGKGAKVGHPGRIFRRNDETEMVAVLFAPFSERALIDGVGSRIEHAGMRAITGDAIPLQVSNVLYQRRRAEFISAIPNHAL